MLLVTLGLTVLDIPMYVSQCDRRKFDDECTQGTVKVPIKRVPRGIIEIVKYQNYNISKYFIL